MKSEKIDIERLRELALDGAQVTADEQHLLDNNDVISAELEQYRSLFTDIRTAFDLRLDEHVLASILPGVRERIASKESPDLLAWLSLRKPLVSFARAASIAIISFAIILFVSSGDPQLSQFLYANVENEININYLDTTEYLQIEASEMEALSLFDEADNIDHNPTVYEENIESIMAEISSLSDDEFQIFIETFEDSDLGIVNKP